MEKQPVKIQLVGKEKDFYLIKFPYLKIPVKVNQNLYSKMIHSQEYELYRQDKKRLRSHSA
ncbi:hypothetical protein [Gaetbulibacter saemankumensis]|uniref:hypothetical protein n=1 Tax=Gaetbulibacter saemankumensis TaxID=311208 RepID=UPI000404247B|nr:hypothetical protein [Gaetbulibacter saemankumensis]